MIPLLTNGIAPVPPLSINSEGSESACITFSETEKLSIRYCLPKENAYDPNQLRVFLLKKKDLPEQSILEIKLDNYTDKAGHLFPLQLFETEDAGYTKTPSDDPRILRFQKAAFAAFCHIARAYQMTPKQQEEKEPISLVKHFGDDTVVLTISNDKKRVPEDFELDNYLPNLFKYGYFKYESPREKTWQNGLDVPFENIDKTTLLTLKRISPEIPNINFVKNIFIELLSTAWSPITSFFLCYQVIETCIEKIRLENCDEFICNLNASKNDAVMMRKAMNDYQRESSEKERIKRLFTVFLSVHTINSLIEGKNLLKRLGVDDSELVEDYEVLYTLRNYFFHAFPVVQENCIANELQLISWEFLLLTLEVLFRFKPPTTGADHTITP